jgi:hypothetical protein
MTNNELPPLPQSLLNLIDEYGMARADGLNDVDRVARWSALIAGIKSYARSALTASEAAAQDHIAGKMVAQEAQEPGERVRYADSLKEVICKKCELPVISSCGGSGCPVPNMYDRRAAPAQAGMTEYRINAEHDAADAFWKYWNENGETGRHGYYESTWGAINAAIRAVGVRVIEARGRK